MNIDDLIKLSALFLDEKKDDSELVSTVVSNGYDIRQAERIVAFLPIAFGRVVINQIGKVEFSSKYKIKEGSKALLFDEEPIYRLAVYLAIDSYKTGSIGREVYSAIATRSAELGAVNKALNTSDNIDGAKFSPVLLFGYQTLGKKKGFWNKIFS